MAMTFNKLIAASKKIVVTAESVERLKKRLSAAKERFAQEAKQKEVDQDFLNKEYTL